MDAPLRNSNPVLDWPEGGNSRAPYRAFSDPAVYSAEQTRIFQGAVWQFLCLANEVPEPGDYKTTFAGETLVVVTRGEDGALRALSSCLES